MPTARQGRIAGMVLALWSAALPAAADDWRPLNGLAIAEALTGRKVIYDNAWQDFRASGRTLYNAGADSWGTWTTRGDQYCSQWPPSTTWACYHVDLKDDGSAVRFRGTGEDITVGRFAE